MRKIVKVTYNSESLHTEIVVDGQSFDTSRINGKEIADWAYPFMMRKVKWNGFYDEMVEALGGEKTFDLIFDGSEEALNELKEAWEDAPVNVISEENVGNNVVIEYDESTFNTTITVNGTPFDTSRINGKEIEDWVYPFMVRKVKWDGIFEELAKVIGSDEYTIQFSGSNSAMNALMEECPETIEISKKRNSHNRSKISANTQNEKSEKQKKRELFLQRKADFLKKYGAAYQYSNNDNLQQVADHYYAQGIWNRDFRGRKSKGERFLIMSYVLETSLGSKNPKAGNEIDYNDHNLKKIANMFYYGGYYASPNYEKAVEWFTKAAERDLTFAQNKLGDCYYLGNGVKQNYEKAVEWYTKAAEQGNSEAQDTLGDCYYLGNGVEQNYEKAVEWYTEAAESNNIYAMYDLAVCYYYGKGTSQDYQEAVRLFKSAAYEGSVESLNFLGDCYYEGNGVTQSYSTAVSLYNEAMSNNSPQAYYNLGSCYRWGNGVPKDKAKAKELFKKGIELGSTNCSEAYEDMLKNDDKIKMAKKIGGEVLNGLGIQGGILGGLGMLGKACINSLIDDDDDDED